MGKAPGAGFYYTTIKQKKRKILKFFEKKAKKRLDNIGLYALYFIYTQDT
jgi:hypothetical protein